MGKSFGNYVALTEKPNDMFGKLMSITDDLIISYFTLLTDVPLSEISDMEKSMKEGSNPMEFKKKLAFTITADLNSEREAKEAQEHFEKTVQKGDVPQDISILAVPTETYASLGTVALVKESGVASSNNEARRLIEQGAVQLNGQKITDPNAKPDINDGDILKVGKLNFFKLKK
jgi:tyrosyl-tRNA synthetase